MSPGVIRYAIKLCLSAETGSGSLVQAARSPLTGPIVENAGWLNRVTAMMRQQGNVEVARSLGERIGVSTGAEARAAVERVAALGVSMLKIRNDPPTPVYFALLNEARRRNIRVVGHPPERGPRIADASDSGLASIEHLLLTVRPGTSGATLDLMSAEARADLLTRLARNRTVMVPTIIAGIGFRRMPDTLVLAIIDDTTGSRDPRRPYLPDQMARQWRGQIEMKKLEGPQPDWVTLTRQAAANLGAIDSARVPILVGTDLGAPLAYPGFAVHDELALLVREGGLTPARALWGATLGPAQFFGLERELGSVDVGLRANLVLLDADPLADVANVGRINSVILGGRLLDRATLDRILRDVAAKR